MSNPKGNPKLYRHGFGPKKGHKLPYEKRAILFMAFVKTYFMNYGSYPNPYRIRDEFELCESAFQHIWRKMKDEGRIVRSANNLNYKFTNKDFIDVCTRVAKKHATTDK